MRLYLTNSAADYTPATKRGAWTLATATLALKLSTSKAGVAASAAATKPSTGTNTCLLGRWISDPATVAATVGGLGVGSVAGRVESNSSLLAYPWVHVYVLVGSTDVVRGTLFNGGAITSTKDYGQTFTTTTRGQSAAFGCAQVAVQVGDRFVVELGYLTTAATSGYTSTVNYGNTGATDLLPGVTAVTTNPGWVELPIDAAFTASTWAGPVIKSSAVWTSASGLASVAVIGPNLVALGDTLLAACSQSTAAAAGTTAPAGWAKIGTQPAIGGGWTSFWTKTALAGDVATGTGVSYTWTHNSSASAAGAILCLPQGVLDPTTPVSTPDYNNGASSPASANAVTPSRAGCLELAFFWGSTINNWWTTTDVGITDRLHIQSGGQHMLVVAKQAATSAALPAISAAEQTSTAWGAASLLIQPPASGGGPAPGQFFPFLGHHELDGERELWTPRRELARPRRRRVLDHAASLTTRVPVPA